MKSNLHRVLPRLALALAAACLATPAMAQTFVGTNQPGGGTVFGFTVLSAVTNLSLRITNTSSAFSHLYLKRGGEAWLTNYDFVSRLDRTSK